MTPTSRSAGGDADQVRVGTLLPLGARLGEYQVTGVIDQGMFGVVYAGSEHASGHKVAIKEYLPATLADRMADGSVVVRSLRYQQAFREGMQGFLSEARTLADLAEPALVKVFRFWEQYGTAYIAMPLYEGRTLKDVLRDSPKPGEAWLKAMVAPVLDALATLHRSDRYPCDVTPDNILIRSDGAALLFDLGTARRIIASTTEDVTVVLKPGFAPIEQYARDPSMSEGPWTDIYAVASVLHLAITGKPPPAPTARIVSDTMRPLGDVTKDYSEVFLEGIDRGLAVRPEHRPQTIMEFRAALGIPAVALGAAPLEQTVPTPAAPSTDADEVGPSPELDPIPPVDPQEVTRIRVLGDGTKVTPPQPLPEQRSPPPSSQSTAGGRPGGGQWKLVVSLVVVLGLAGLGLLVWGPGRPVPPMTADNASSRKVVPTSAQPSPPAATSAPSAETAAPPVTPAEVGPKREPPTQAAAPSPESRQNFPAPAPDRKTDVAASLPNPDSTMAPNPPVASPSTPGRAASNAVPVTSVPEGTAASATSAPPVPRTGKIQFSIKPWGEIVVDGKKRGLSPPIKELSIPAGKHRIEIRNSTFPGYASEIDVKAGSSVSIAHSFKSP